jgi:hypothetical protein
MHSVLWLFFLHPWPRLFMMRQKLDNLCWKKAAVKIQRKSLLFAMKLSDVRLLKWKNSCSMLAKHQTWHGQEYGLF